MRLFGAVLLAASLGAACAARGAPQPDLDRVERLVVEATNDFRRAQGRSPLERHGKLAAAAERFAKFMAATGKFSHEADGRKPRERVVEQGYRYCMVAENISYQYSSAGLETRELASRLVEGWKRSPGHRANMLDGVAVHTAVAVARSATTGYFYAVQLFGSPRASGARC
jgi:uncharacterized protein YkwD